MIYTSDGHYIRSKVWNGTVWGRGTKNPNNNIGVSSCYFPAVAGGDDAPVVFLPTQTLLHTQYNYAKNSWGKEIRVIPQPVTTTSAPVLSIDSKGDLHLFWGGSPKANHIYYKQMSGGIWDALPTDWIDESTEKLLINDSLTSIYNADNGIGLFYLTKPSTAPLYNVKSGSE